MMKNNKPQRTIWEVLNSVSYSFNVGEDAERVDKEYLKILHNGQAENNLSKIYDFIETAERGAKPFGDSNIPLIIEEAYKADSVRLFHFIEGKNDLISYWVFLSMICSKDILFSFAEMESDNPLFHFECARQILTRFLCNEGYESPCANAVIKFALKDIALWSFWTKKYEHNSKWAKITWIVLQELESRELIEYSKNINLITSYTHETGKLLEDGFNSVDAVKKNQILSIISKTIYEQWETALSIAKKDSKYQNSILISNYASVLLSSMDFLFSDNGLWAEQFNKQVCLLNSDTQKWYSSETNYSSSFFLNLTNIYYLIVIKKDEQKLLNQDSVRTSAEIIKFLLTKYEYLWKYNDSVARVNQIKEIIL